MSLMFTAGIAPIIIHTNSYIISHPFCCVYFYFFVT